MKEDYNWWEDPKNKEEVERLSWWNHPENKEIFELPISVISDGKYWCASFNDETKEVFGDILHGCGQGESKDEAIRQMFSIIKFHHDYSELRILNYQRFVPFRKGDWKQTGGTWFVIFGIHFYFRCGNNMKGGRYMPFTKLNISIHSEWSVYKRWKNKNSR